VIQSKLNRFVKKVVFSIQLSPTTIPQVDDNPVFDDAVGPGVVAFRYSTFIP
jgi:hypothetical protein